MKTMPVLSVNQEERTENLMFEPNSDAKSSRPENDTTSFNSETKSHIFTRQLIQSVVGWPHIFTRESISLGMACFSLVHMLAGWNSWIPFSSQGFNSYISGWLSPPWYHPPNTEHHCFEYHKLCHFNHHVYRQLEPSPCTIHTYLVRIWYSHYNYPMVFLWSHQFIHLWPKIPVISKYSLY